MDFFLKITGIQSCCTIPDLCNLVVQKQNTQFVEGQRWPGLGKEGEQGFAPGTWWWSCLLRRAAPLAPDIYHYLAWHKYINRQITCAVNSRELPAVRIVLITLKINSVLLWAWVFVGFFFCKTSSYSSGKWRRAGEKPKCCYKQKMSMQLMDIIWSQLDKAPGTWIWMDHTYYSDFLSFPGNSVFCSCC